MKKIIHLEKRFNNNKNVSIQSDVEYFSHLQRLENIKKERGANGVIEMISHIAIYVALISVVWIAFMIIS
tara:strand:+ start:295 stop:504 length:210 start_codon:yes stop_codon:yes gene_type:complete